MYRPRFQPQLGRGPTASRDCGPRSVQMGIDALTHGDLRPDIPEIRRRMGRSGNLTTFVTHSEACVDSYTRVRGRRPLRYAIVRTVADLKEAASADRPVQICIDYGNFNRTGKTGDPGYMDDHSILVRGETRRDDDVWWLMFDPLDDARRSSIPQGPRWVKRERIVDAAEAFLGGGNGNTWSGVFLGGEKRG